MKLFLYLLDLLDRIIVYFRPRKDFILDDDLKELYVPDEEEVE